MHSNGSRHFVTACICATAIFGSKTAAAQSAPAPCSLLTSAQISAAVGVNVGAACLIKVYGPNVTDQMSMEKTLAGNVLAKLSSG